MGRPGSSREAVKEDHGGRRCMLSYMFLLKDQLSLPVGQTCLGGTVVSDWYLEQVGEGDNIMPIVQSIIPVSNVPSRPLTSYLLQVLAHLGRLAASFRVSALLLLSSINPLIKPPSLPPFQVNHLGSDLVPHSKTA